MAATSHPLATGSAIEVLRAGGSAADAAVTAVAVLSVVEPHMTGIGGDCFCLVSKAGAPAWGYNGSGRAAAAVRAETLIDQGIKEIGFDSVHAVTVPGAVEAWAAILRQFGHFGLDRALAPAIHYAEHGFPVGQRVAYDWARAAERLRADQGARRHYLVDGQPPAFGDVIRLPALAATLRAIATEGPDALYQGAIAADIVDSLRARGSLLDYQDFARHRGEAVPPIASNYRGLDVLEMPPNTQGLAALVLLNILEGFDLARLDPTGPERFHIALEAARLAYAVRNSHIADPPFMATSVPALLDKAFARSLAERIDRRQRVVLPAAPVPGSDTVYVSVVDRDRMAVSLINSLYEPFGVGIATVRSGVLLQNRGACFVVDPGHPNSIGPGKRPLHTIIPSLGMRQGRCELCFGVMGGAFQVMGHAHVVSNMIDFGMDVQQAIDVPRAFFDEAAVQVERGVPAATLQGLRERGHAVAVRDLPLGGGQVIQVDWDRGVLIGGSDARKDGLALGY